LNWVYAPFPVIPITDIPISDMTTPSPQSEYREWHLRSMT
jgi:hypothetical protein